MSRTSYPLLTSAVAQGRPGHGIGFRRGTKKWVRRSRIETQQTSQGDYCLLSVLVLGELTTQHIQKGLAESGQGLMLGQKHTIAIRNAGFERPQVD